MVGGYRRPPVPIPCAPCSLSTSGRSSRLPRSRLLPLPFAKDYQARPVSSGLVLGSVFLHHDGGVPPFPVGLSCRGSPGTIPGCDRWCGTTLAIGVVDMAWTIRLVAGNEYRSEPRSDVAPKTICYRTRVTACNFPFGLRLEQG